MTRCILPSELALNEALPWTVYDEFAHLLLREGHVIRMQRQLDAPWGLPPCEKARRHPEGAPFGIHKHG